jgi:probable RNA-binding protein EIF1AD
MIRGTQNLMRFVLLLVGAQVEFADGRRTLCLLPAKFHKKIWIKRGTFLIIQTIESSELGDSAITGQITQVLYADHVKQLKRMVGVWPAGFDVETAAQGDTSDRISAALSSLEISSTKTESKGAKSSDSSTSSDDDLPPRIENRRIVVYEASDADSDD